MIVAISETHAQPGVLRTLTIAVASGVAILVAGEAVWMGMIAVYTRHPTPFPCFIPAMSLFLTADSGWI